MWEKFCALLLAGNGCGLDQGKPSRPLETQEQWLFSSTTAIAARVLCFVSPSAAVKCELYYLSRFLPLFFPDRKLLGMMKRVFLFLAGLRLLGKRRVRNGHTGSLCLLARRGSPRFTSAISVEKREECSFFVTVTPFTRACKCLTNGGSQLGVNRMK